MSQRKGGCWHANKLVFGGNPIVVHCTAIHQRATHQCGGSENVVIGLHGAIDVKRNTVVGLDVFEVLNWISIYFCSFCGHFAVGIVCLLANVFVFNFILFRILILVLEDFGVVCGEEWRRLIPERIEERWNREKHGCGAINRRECSVVCAHVHVQCENTTWMFRKCWMRRYVVEKKRRSCPRNEQTTDLLDHHSIEQEQSETRYPDKVELFDGIIPRGGGVRN